MIYKVLKSSFDGISGGETRYESIDAVLRDVCYHKGWDSREQLHKAIRNWAKHAGAGDIFTTQVTAIVAVGVGKSLHADDICTECDHEGMDYSDLEPVEDGGIEQIVTCPGCGGRWLDVFVLSERKELFKLNEVKGNG